MYNRSVSFFIKTLEFTVIILMAVLVLDVLWQVITRYLFSKSASWTEELATILVIWVAVSGACLGFIKKSHLGIDFLANKLNERPRALLDIAVYLLVAVFAGYLMIYGGWLLVSRTLTLNQLTPALGVKRGYVYIIMPAGGVFILFFSVTTVIKRIIFVAKGK